MQEADCDTFSSTSDGQLKRVLEACTLLDGRRYDSASLCSMSRHDLERAVLYVWMPSFPPLFRWTLPHIAEAILRYQQSTSGKCLWSSLPPEILAQVFAEVATDHADAIMAASQKARTRARRKLLRLACIDKAWLALTAHFLSQKLRLSNEDEFTTSSSIVSLQASVFQPRNLSHIVCLHVAGARLTRFVGLKRMMPLLEHVIVDIEPSTCPAAMFGELQGMSLTLWLPDGPFKGAKKVIADILSSIAASPCQPALLRLGEELNCKYPSPFAPVLLPSYLAKLSCDTIVLEAVNAHISLPSVHMPAAPLSSSLRKLVMTGIMLSQGLAISIIARLPASIEDVTLRFFEMDWDLSEALEDSLKALAIANKRGISLQQMKRLEVQQMDCCDLWPVLNLFAKSSVEDIIIRWQCLELDGGSPLGYPFDAAVLADALPNLKKLVLPAHLLTVYDRDLRAAYTDVRWNSWPYCEYGLVEHYDPWTIVEYEALLEEHDLSTDGPSREGYQQEMVTLYDRYKIAIAAREGWQDDMAWMRRRHTQSIRALKRVLEPRGVKVECYDSSGTFESSVLPFP